MRHLFSASFLLAGFVLHAAGLASTAAKRDHTQPTFNRRKTLGFGPLHPHAVFRSPSDHIATLDTHTDDPYTVAHQFLARILGHQLSEANTFTIRKDSYTDKKTGVTHVYVRQIVNGVEVVDGDMNLNVKDGRVMSYGNSFYNGPIPPFAGEVGGAHHHPQSDHCLRLTDELQSQQLSGQVIMDSRSHTLDQLHQWNCAQTKLVDRESPIGDPRVALLHFMAIATPHEHVVADIGARFQEYVDNMTSMFEMTFVGSHQVQVEMLDNVPDAVGPVKTKIAYVQVPQGESTVLKLVWRFEVEMKDNWYEATVSAIPPHTIISVVDWASDSVLPIPEIPKESTTYRVFAWGLNDPTEGNRSDQKAIADVRASPIGWHSLPYTHDPDFDASDGEFYRNTTTTWGNNVFAHENWDSKWQWIDQYRPSGGPTLNFTFPYDPRPTDRDDAVDEAHKHVNASITQLFYTANMFHDLFYLYGFDELSGNFQQYNFGKGGMESDAVIMNAQDGSGFNNADFMTPPDGQNGRCRMFLWNTALPYRDGDMEAGIVVHELAHGLSTRLTGGPANSGCLGWGESGGMGEGWGDYLASVIRSTKNYSDYPMGAWASNRPGGIRNFPYSTNSTINPSTYKTLDEPGYWGLHTIGEVWAQILWVMQQRLIAKHGFVESLFPPRDEEGGDFYRDKNGMKIPRYGNALAVQLVVYGMKMQPCRPSFFDARDSIIQADLILTGGENHCELWEAFGSRGLGPNATVQGRTPWGGGVRTDDFGVPVACQ